jgi:pimeloyl-ACP methyl ester carboxylesterase
MVEPTELMPAPEFFTREGVQSAWYSWGKQTGIPVVLQHGFAADTKSNWVVPGLVAALVDNGRWVVGLDARGHGASEKVRNSQLVGHAHGAADVRTLIDLLESTFGVTQVDFAGYSMGGHIGLHVLASEPRIRRAVIAGIGANALGAVDGGDRTTNLNREAIATAMERYLAEPGLDVKTQITDTNARDFVRYARYTGADMSALVAHLRANPTRPGPFNNLVADVMVLAGSEDHLARDLEALAAALPGARVVRSPGTHLSAIVDPVFREAFSSFLS